MAKITTTQGTRFLEQMQREMFSDDQEAKDAITLLFNKLMDIEREIPSSEYIVTIYDGELEINAIVIDDKVFSDNDLDYNFVDREDEIENLRGEIRQSVQESDRTMVDNDIEELLTYRDNVVLSSTSTNKYISRFENATAFDAFCAVVLELQEALEQEGV